MLKISSLILLTTLLLQATAPAIAASLPVQGQEAFQENLLVNPGGENGTAGFTASGGTFTSNATAKLFGNAGLEWDSSAAGQTLISKAVPVPAGLAGKPGIAYCYLKTAAGIGTHTMAVDNGTTEIAAAQGVGAIASAATRNSSQFTWPASGSVRLKLTSTAANEPSLYIDGCYLGTGEVETRLADAEAALGKKNYVQNPNARLNATSGVTYANVTPGRNTTAPTLGASSEYAFTIDSATDLVTFALNPFDRYLKDTGICAAEITYTADANAENVQLQVIRNGAVIGQKNLYTPFPAGNNGTVGVGAFPCGDLTNPTTIAIAGTSATATALKVARVRVTEAEWEKAQIGGTKVGQLVVSNCTNTWDANNSTGTPVNFSANSGCTYTVTQGSGIIQAPATQVPGVTFTGAAQPGNYTFRITGQIGQSAGAAYISWLRMSDGTNSSVEGTMQAASYTYPGEKSFDIDYSGVGPAGKTVQVQSRVQSGGNSQIDARSNVNKFVIDIYRQPTDASVVNLKTQNGDFDSIPYTPIFTGLGTVTNVSFSHRREGDSLFVTGSFTTGTTTATPPQVSLPSPLIIGGSSIIKAIGSVGQGNVSAALTVPLITGGTNYITFGEQSASRNSLAIANGNSIIASNTNYTVNAGPIPIVGWTKSNTAVNMAGEPGSWSTILQAASNSWNWSSTTYADVTNGTSIVKANEVNNNFGTVTCGTGGIAGCTVTPKVTGGYDLCYNSNAYSNAGSGALTTVGLFDGNNAALATPSSWSSNGAGFITPISACTVVNLSGGVPFSFKLRGVMNTGAGYLFGGYNAAGALITFSLSPRTQNLPGLMGGGGSAEVSAQVQATAAVNQTAQAPLILPQINWDTGGNYNLSTGRFTAPTFGRYEVTINGVQVNAATTYRIYKNGVLFTSLVDVVANNPARQSGVNSLQLGAGDYIAVVPDTASTLSYAASIPPVITFKKIN